MAVHLLTVVGGRISTLGPMLDHYLALHIDSFHIIVHRRDKNDSIMDEVRPVVASRGLSIKEQLIGDWEKCQLIGISQVGAASGEEWFIVADQDELHEYNEDIHSLLSFCADNDYNYLSGCFVDRFCRDGTLKAINEELALSDQYPVGSYFTRPILGGNPFKVAVARGGTRFSNCGHHWSTNGRGCPSAIHLTQVNHYKWTAGLCEYMVSRSASTQASRAIVSEDHRFLSYLKHTGGTIDLRDTRILAAMCRPQYPHWPLICKRYDQISAAYRSLRKGNDSEASAEHTDHWRQYL